MKPFSFYCSMLAVILTGITAVAQTYVPDSSFNNAGYSFFHLGNQPVVAGCRILQAKDEKLLVAGYIDDSVALWRFTTNGSLDAGFGKGGYTSLKTSLTIVVRDFCIQRDEKIVVLLNAQKFFYPNIQNNEGMIMLVRFNTDGSPDASFGNNGFVVHKPMSGFEYQPLSLSIDSFGLTDRFYVGAAAYETGQYGCVPNGRWTIAKYTAAGVPDSTFNGIGFLQQTSANIKLQVTTTPIAFPYSLKVLPQQKLLVAGSLAPADSTDFSLRINSDGTYDNSYGMIGRKLYTGTDWITDARIAPDESIYFYSSYILNNGSGNTSKLGIKKVNAQGVPVQNFGGAGAIVFYGIYGSAISFDRNDRMIVGWYESTNSNSQKIHLRRYLSSGLIDPNFGTNGEIISEPVLNDLYVNQSGIMDMYWRQTNHQLIFLTSRFNLFERYYFGVFKYREAWPTSIGSILPLAQKFTVYPSPAGQSVSVVTAQPMRSYYIANMQGQVVQTGANIQRKNLEIFLGDLPSGQYILHLQMSSGERCSKGFLKQ